MVGSYGRITAMELGVFFCFFVFFVSPCPQIWSSVCPCPYSSPFMSRKTLLSPVSITESGFAGARFRLGSHGSLTFFFPSPTVRKLPSSCQTGSQLNSSDVQIGYSPCFQLLKGDAVLGGGRPPTPAGIRGAIPRFPLQGPPSIPSFTPSPLHSFPPLHHQSLGRRTCAVVVSGVSDSACLGFELFYFGRPQSDPGRGNNFANTTGVKPRKLSRHMEGSDCGVEIYPTVLAS